MKYKLFILTYSLFLFCVSLYSFTQIDLNLTISSNNIWQTIQKSFQYLGYYQRPLSAFIFIFLTLVFFLFHFLFTILAGSGKISVKQAWRLVFLITLILLLSYPAFSYDIFNYIFNARMITKYGVDPHIYKALDFPYDPWIRFMRWTHVTTPYPWGWTLLGVVPSLLGFQIFIITLLNFKLLMALFYLGTVYIMGKIMETINPKNKIVAMIFVATNPLIIVESLVSGHHEIVMVFFALLSLYLLFIKKRQWLSLFFLGISMSIKQVTLPLLSLWVIKNIKLPVVLMIIGLILFQLIFHREFQPWYFLWILPFAPLLTVNQKILSLFSLLSWGCLLRYAPYLYFGNWDWPVMWIVNYLTILPVLTYLIFLCYRYLKNTSGK